MRKLELAKTNFMQAVSVLTLLAALSSPPAWAQSDRPAPRQPDVKNPPRGQDFPGPRPTPPRDTTPPVPPPRTGLHGFADLHAHLMAHEGFGGNLFHGQAEGVHHTALGWCTSAHGAAGVGINPEIGHLVGGYPEFDGWPRFTTLIHQQAHVDWIKRAYEGGLRLVSMLAVNNELAADRYAPLGFANRYPLDDRSAIDRQIVAMRGMASRNSRWMEIATSPADARRIIRENKLAVVLGVEVDSLGNWKTPADLPRDPAEARRVISTELQRLYDMGVRQITPIHLSDNAFGGCAIYRRAFDANNKHLTRSHHTVEEGWDSGIRFKLDQDSIKSGILKPIALVLSYGIGTQASRQWDDKRSHRNANGLTPHGIILLEEMMRLRMIIDVDHMSEKSMDEALSMMERARYPVIASHTSFRDLSITAGVEFDGSDRAKRAYDTSDIHKVAHEADKPAAVIERIRRLSGIVAPILNQGDIRSWGTRVRNDSAGSSKSWAQAYLYAVEKMGGRSVALASDINGLAGQPGPRFGTYASHSLHGDTIREGRRREQADAQTNGVRYASPILDYRRYRFEGPEVPPLGRPDVYTIEEEQIWEAAAIYKSRTNPDRADLPRRLSPTHNGKIRNLAKGFWAAETGRALEGRGELLAGNTYAEQRAAFLVARGTEPTADRSLDPREVRRLHPIIKGIWDKWRAMEGSNPPLTRSTAGRRDFDINLDGVAHYGMLPDFIQDLRNVGLTERDLAPLFRSAEHYIEMWERAERSAPPPSLRTVTVTIHQVRQIDNLDSETILGRDRSDFYARVTIAGDVQTSPVVNERDNVSPEWSFSRSTTENTISITISLFDEDGGFSGPDDHCDIHPFGGRRDLVITYDLLPGRISGGASGVRGSRIHVIGAGDRNRAEIWFSVNHR